MGSWVSARRAGLAVMAVGVAGLLVIASDTPARPVLSRAGGRPPGAEGSGTMVGSRGVFAAVEGSRLELRSAETGRILHVLGRVGQSWTNNGFAFAGDGRN